MKYNKRMHATGDNERACSAFELETKMPALIRILQYFRRPDKNTSLAVMFAGFAIYAVGALLGYRFVALGGWLTAVVAIINYMRAFFADTGIPPKVRQPWDK